MKITFLSTMIFLFTSTLLFAQKNEVSVGFPSVSVLSGALPTYRNTAASVLFDKSEIYLLHMHTKRKSSLSLPIFYYTRSLSKKSYLRTSFSFQSEEIVKSQNIHCADCGSVSDDYKGKYSQVKWHVGLAWHFIQRKKTAIYMAADFTNGLKHLKEQGHYENHAWGSNWVEYTKNVWLYYPGFNPAIGCRMIVNKRFSISYEVGLEVSFTTNASFTSMGAFNPLNRFSLNYCF
jgi:hypothetical protein